MKAEKSTNIHKIKLIYASKLKEYVIGKNIRKKTHNLTQNHVCNDPINIQIKAFHFVFQK